MLISTDVDRAVAALRGGGLVGLPTETVYGLGANATDEQAVRRIFEVKGRPTDHPLIVHLGPDADLDGWITPRFDHRDAAQRLAEVVWPGPLTMIMPAGPRVLPIVTGGRATVGIRRPAHPIAIEVLDRFGGGVAAPSANLFGRVSPTTAQHVIHDLGDRLDIRRDVILDGGASAVGVESTIVDLASPEIQVLRHGAITNNEIAAIVSQPIAPTGGPSRASGMLASHYAPHAEVRIAATAAAAERLATRSQAEGKRTQVLDYSDDLLAGARHLYADFRRADREHLDALIVVEPPAIGIGFALRDRLVKAANGSTRSNRVG